MRGLSFIQSAPATACRHSWGVTLQGMMGLQPNSTTGRACTERTANSFAFVQKLWELLKHYNDAFGQATLCLCAAGTHWKWAEAAFLKLSQKNCNCQNHIYFRTTDLAYFFFFLSNLWTKLLCGKTWNCCVAYSSSLTTTDRYRSAFHTEGGIEQLI